MRNRILYVISVLFVLCLFFGCKCRTKIDNPENSIDNKSEKNIRNLYQVDYKQRYGYIDYEGNLVIPLIYVHASRFVDGVAKVSLPNDKKDFFINSDNEKIIIDPEKYNFSSSYKDLEQEYDRLMETERLTEPVPPEGFYVSNYLGYGYFEISQKNESNSIDEMYSGVIDGKGNVILSAQEGLWFTPFIGGMCRITIGPRGFDGYLRKDGKIFWTKDYIKY